MAFKRSGVRTPPAPLSRSGSGLKVAENLHKVESGKTEEMPLTFRSSPPIINLIIPPKNPCTDLYGRPTSRVYTLRRAASAGSSNGRPFL